MSEIAQEKRLAFNERLPISFEFASAQKVASFAAETADLAKIELEKLVDARNTEMKDSLGVSVLLGAGQLFEEDEGVYTRRTSGDFEACLGVSGLFGGLTVFDTSTLSNPDTPCRDYLRPAHARYEVCMVIEPDGVALDRWQRQLIPLGSLEGPIYSKEPDQP